MLNESQLRALFAPLERIEPVPLQLDSVPLSDADFVRLVFDLEATDPSWSLVLTDAQRNLSTSGPHWFVTELEIRLRTQWLHEPQLHELVQRLADLGVPAVVERVNQSLHQLGRPFVLDLRLTITRAPDERPTPQPEVIRPGQAGPDNGSESLVCEHCGTEHVLVTSRKGNPGDSGAWSTEYCLSCGRGVFDIFSVGRYRLWLSTVGSPNQS